MAGMILLGTEPKVGKTYISILLVQELKRLGCTPGYYKFAATGVRNLEQSEAAMVSDACALDQELNEMIPYHYTVSEPVHLAARREQRFIKERVITERYAWNCATHNQMVVEGVGEIVSPLIMENNQVLFQEDLIFKLQLKIFLVIRMSASALSQSVLAVNYLKSISKSPAGIIFNAYNDRNYAHRDSLDLIERCTQTPVIATVQKHQRRLSCRADLLSIINAPETGGFDSEA